MPEQGTEVPQDDQQQNDQTTEDQPTADHAADDDLEAGFKGDVRAEKPAAPEETDPESKGEKDDAAPPAEEVKYRQVTEKEWADLVAKAAEVDKVTKHLDRAFGKVGVVEQALAKLQSQTPRGAEVQVTEEDVADLKKEFPEIGDMTLKALQNVAKKFPGTGPAIDPDEVRNLAAGAISALEVEDLDDEFGNWREIVGTQDDADNKYRKWLATQSEEYRTRVNSTMKASVIARSIRRFQEAEAQAQVEANKADANKAAAAEKEADAQRRRERLNNAAATNQRGRGADSAPSADDDLEAGFKYRSR